MIKAKGKDLYFTGKEKVGHKWVLILIILDRLNNMDLIFIFKIIVVIGIIVGLYAIIRNLDIIKIILIYFKDKLFGK